MKITSQCVVALTWTLKYLGEKRTSCRPVEFLMGGDDLLAAIGKKPSKQGWRQDC
jgi:hypothetical protein